MKQSSRCPECKEVIEGIKWEGGYVTVFEHKGLVNGERHHYRLVVENDRNGVQNNEK